MYPPFAQPQPLPTNAFPVTTSGFHPNHFAWQCNVSPNISEFILDPIWPGCPPVEFSRTSHISEPTADYILEPKVLPGDSEIPSMPSADIDRVQERSQYSDATGSG